MILPNNMVAIRPDEDFRVDSSGLQRADFVNSHMAKALTGTVVGVCESLYFNNMNGRRPVEAQMSMDWDVPIEVKVGDRVLFRYLATVEEEMQINGLYVMPYADLTCRIDEGDTLYPLNGYLLIQPVDDITQAGGLQVVKEEQAAWNMGLVRAEGCMVKAYTDSLMTDVLTGLVGSCVAYPTKRAVRIEVEDYKKFGEGQWSLYRLHRRYIQAIVTP